MDEPACPGGRDARKRITAHEAQVTERTRKLAEATRASERQAARFRKGPPEPPSRKSGDAHGTHGHRPCPPGSVTESHQAPTPDTGLHCHGPLLGTGTAEQSHTRMPRQSRAQKLVADPGQCTCCRAPSHGRHGRTVSRSLWAAARRVGSRAEAAVSPLCSQADRVGADEERECPAVGVGRPLAGAGSPVPCGGRARDVGVPPVPAPRNRSTFEVNLRVQATNARTEQPLRPAILDRTASGGNRPCAGPTPRGWLVSVFEASRRDACAEHA